MTGTIPGSALPTLGILTLNIRGKFNNGNPKFHTITMRDDNNSLIDLRYIQKSSFIINNIYVNTQT